MNQVLWGDAASVNDYLIAIEGISFLNGTATEAYNSANWANYAMAAANVGPSTIYGINFPAAAAGYYDCFVYRRAGSTPSPTADGSPVLSFSLYWDGASVWSAAQPPSASAIAAQIAALGSTIEVNYVGPVLSSGAVVSLIQGDDYFNADGRAISWTIGSTPNLTGASATLELRLATGNPNPGDASVTLTGTIVNAGTSSQTIYFEMPRSTSSQLALGSGGYSFSAYVTLSDGHVATQIQGQVNVVAGP